MVKRNGIISALLFIGVLFSRYEMPKAIFTYKDVKTWTLTDAALLSTLPDNTIKVGGNNYKTDGVQGMNVGKNFIYSAKVYTGNANVDAVTIYRTNVDKKSTVKMSCTSSCAHAGHANDLHVVTDKNDKNHLLAATSNADHAIASYTINDTTLTYTGYIRLRDTDGNLKSCSAVRHVKHANGIFYMLFKSGETFYHGQIKEADITGNKNTPKEIKIYKLAILDKKNGLFAKSGGYENYKNMETWVGQGFFYNAKEKVIYAPYFEPRGNKTYLTTSVILTYDVSSIVTNAALNTKEDQNRVIFPTVTSFLFKAGDKGWNGIEVESSGFRTSQTDNGDLKLYFNMNVSPASNDGVYYFKNYKSGSINKKSVYDDSKKYYRVKYDGNGGTDEGTNSTQGFYSMNVTRHIYGLSSNLRPNYFKNGKKTFQGWHLYRKSDKKKLYAYQENNEQKVKWCTDQENKDKTKGCINLAVYKDKQSISKLSSVDGDLITLTAVWK